MGFCCGYLLLRLRTLSRNLVTVEAVCPIIGHYCRRLSFYLFKGIHVSSNLVLLVGGYHMRLFGIPYLHSITVSLVYSPISSCTLALTGNWLVVVASILYHITLHLVVYNILTHLGTQVRVCIYFAASS